MNMWAKVYVPLDTVGYSAATGLALWPTLWRDKLENISE